MTDFTIHIKIEAPELCAVLGALAGARPMLQPSVPSVAAAPAPHSAQPPALAVPVASAPMAAPVAPPPAAVAAPTAARQYDFKELQLAATSLCDAGKRDAVMALLGQFQIKALSGLSPEQYGAFATALRGLGAKI